MADGNGRLGVVRLGIAATDTSDARGLPPILAATDRGASDDSIDPLLASVTLVSRYELGAGARAVGNVAPTDIESRQDEVLAVELDGFTLFTSADRLADTIERRALTLESQGLATLEDALAAPRATRDIAGIVDIAARAVSVLRLEPDDIVRGAADALRDWAKDYAASRITDALTEQVRLGATWLGTKALMWAIERQVSGRTRVCSWAGSSGAALENVNEETIKGLMAAGGEGAAKSLPLLVFIHGTASSTNGSFGELRTAAAETEWSAIRQSYGQRILALEHCTFSESPIENALVLAATLPKGAEIHLVTHSRGGIVGDLMCLGATSADRIKDFGRTSGQSASATGKKGGKDDADLALADEHDREMLGRLLKLLTDKRIRVTRYLRAACPARGTLLASENTDLFLSTILNLITALPPFAGNPIVAGIKRIVLEIAKNRTRADLVPGLEAMLPHSPYARLTDAIVRPTDLAMAVIAGDIQGSGLFKRIGVFLTDRFIFERGDHDLVVETDSMFGGVARPTGTFYRFEQSPDVSHFRYFANRSSRRAVAEWLTSRDDSTLQGFSPFKEAERIISPTVRSARAMRAALATGPRPIVFLLPGIMGSHLKVNQRRVWFEPLRVAFAGLGALRASEAGVAPDAMFEMFYGSLQEYLEASNTVVPFPYDWRMSILDAGRKLAEQIESTLSVPANAKVPIRIVAHSMGGLVVRAMIAERPDVWSRVIQHPEARVVMLGTPNRGSHLMVEMLLGLGSTIRKLAVLDSRNDLQDLLGIIAEYPGALELLPSPLLSDESGEARDYLEAANWPAWAAKNDDPWFGMQLGGRPQKAVLDRVRETWKRIDESQVDRARFLYVAGQADMTPSGMRIINDRPRMLGTPRGDGSVSWSSGLLEAVRAWYMPGVAHGDLARTEIWFDAIAELLDKGETTQLSRTPPVAREVRSAIPYDAGPVLFPSDEEAQAAVLGGRRTRTRRPAVPPLHVSCRSGDLLHARDPVIVGQYEHDPIAGPLRLVDRELVGGALARRSRLGLSPGPRGSACVAFSSADDERGAVVIGLGAFGELSARALAECVKAGALEYLMQVRERRRDGRGRANDEDIGLASLLLGYNSTTSISIEDSVDAVIRGVVQANREIAGVAGDAVRISRLEFVELYTDRAIAAARALTETRKRLLDDVKDAAAITIEPRLVRGRGERMRFDASDSQFYWPRLLVLKAKESESRVTAGVSRSLSFLYLGRRARAEQIVEDSQAALVDRMVASIIRDTNYRPDLSKTLFQILLPNRFKEPARQVDRLVLVVDDVTANLPWEMMVADAEPLASRVAMVRQLTRMNFRAQVREASQRSAFVVGDPSTRGFRKAFGTDDPPQLAGAEQEARVVAQTLRAHRFDVTEIPPRAAAVTVISQLLDRHYRFVHIAAHGIYRHPDTNGIERSGVILSDGIVLTAAEIGKMEIVPDLVFLNCCFLGKVDSEAPQPAVHFNRLAASLAGELIGMGVRAVIVSGWAVDDTAAETFARTFYESLLERRSSFGAAVHEARRETWNRHRATNTWGAYQAYGDPDYVVDPSARARNGRVRGTMDSVDVAVEELLLRLAALRDLARTTLDTPAIERTIAEAKDELRKAPPAWQARGDVKAAVAELYAEFGPAYFPLAREEYEAALRAESSGGPLPVRTIEQLANLEAREGETRGDPALIESAIRRLHHLARLETSLPAGSLIVPKRGDKPSQGANQHTVENIERRSLIGSAHKRLAVVAARSGNRTEAEAQLALAIDWYESPTSSGMNEALAAYPLLNHLQLMALKTPDAALIPAIQQTRGKLARNFESSRGYWDAVGIADATLTQHMHDGALAQDPDIVERLIALYAHQRSLVPEIPRERDSVVAQLRSLADLNRCIGKLPALTERLGRIARAVAGERVAPGDAGAQSRHATAKATKKSMRKPGGSKRSPRAGAKQRRPSTRSAK